MHETFLLSDILKARTDHECNTIRDFKNSTKVKSIFIEVAYKNVHTKIIFFSNKLWKKKQIEK